MRVFPHMVFFLLYGNVLFSMVQSESAGLAGVSSGLGLDDGLLVCTLLLLI